MLQSPLLMLFRALDSEVGEELVGGWPILPEFELEIFPHQVLSVSPLRITFTFGT